MNKNEEMREWEKQKELFCELAERIGKEREKALEKALKEAKEAVARFNAIRLIDLIPYGKDNAISRKVLVEKADFFGLIPNNVRSKDRYTRKLIQKAREDNVIIAKPTGGYYIPDEDDATELAEYIATEHSRALAIHSDLVMANRVFEDMVHGRLKKPERRYPDEED